MPASEIVIGDGLSIPLAEVRFETARSSGPGGQHVNKTESKVTLVFDVTGSAVLDDDQVTLLSERLASRISKAGELRVSAQSHRSQKANREDAIERFATLLRDALEPVAERRPTRVPAGAKRQRLETKQKRSRQKQLRKRPDWE